MKILYLFGEYYRQCKMDRERIKYGEAVAAHLDVEFRCWGNGHSGYDDKLSVVKNVAKLDFQPDIIWVYKPQEYVDFKYCSYPAMVTMNEVSRPEELAEISDHNISLVIYHHENDLPELEKIAQSGRRFIHSLHGADERTFISTRPIADRAHDCLSSGMTVAQFYPLRQRFATLINDGRLPGIVRKHPGYRLKTWKVSEEQFKQYANVLSNSKIVISCSSIWKYPLSKYTEAMAAGAVVVGDMPDDSVFRSTLGKHLVEVQQDASNDDLIATVKGLLADPERMQETATAGYCEYMAGHTNRHYAERLVKAVGDFLGDR